MKEWTKKELAAFGKDLRMAKLGVLCKYGFSDTEIANVLGVSESMVRKLINELEIEKIG